MEAYTNEILIGMLALFVIMTILLIIAFVKIGRINKRYRKIVGNSSAENVDELLMNLQDKLEGLAAKAHVQAEAIEDIRRIMRTMKANLAIKRYNAFSNQGSDLSFSLAILDEEQDGVVLTGIHSREESYLYAKPVGKGTSTYTLTPEEKEVIAQTAGKKQSDAPGRM